MLSRPELPASATDARVGAVGMVAVALTVLAVAYGPPLQPFAITTLVVLSYAVPVIALELLVRRVHRNETTGLSWTGVPTPDVGRVALKLLGLSATVLFFVAAHILFRLYDIPTLRAVGNFALVFLPMLVCVVIAYFYAIDGRQRNPRDAYWELGAMIAGQVPVRLTPTLRDHMLGWAVKAFFLPIMLYYLMLNTTRIGQISENFSGGALEIALGLLVVSAFLDLTVAVVGYTLTCRLFDAHIRSPNGYLAAWVVTLACYYPFNEIVLNQVFDFQNELAWDDVILDHPLIFWPWLCAVLLLWGLHIWCKFVYGLRFSNLTHRGIVTGGPYRYSKHPDYVTKSIYFWLTAAPFLTAADGWTAVTSTVALAVVNLIYFARARTEEWHLSADPVYVEYALAMNERSIFRGIARVLPVLRYVPPGQEVVEAERMPVGRMAAGE
jgi:protein-S-isoprenylcysteine O-methyltransferase Ste14